MSFIILPFPFTRVREWLTGITAGQDVYRLNISPIDFRNIA